MKLEALPVYRIPARNTDPDSENPIHGDAVAARHGFAAGLIPGVSVYGYMTVPLIRQLGRDWLERGWMRIRFRKPFYDGDELFARAVAVEGDAMQVTAMAEGEVRVSAEAGLDDPPAAWPLEDFPAHPLPDPRPTASKATLYANLVLGTVREHPAAEHARLVGSLADPLPFYRGPAAVVHPTVLLGLANVLLMRNFVLPPWLHASSELRNFAAPGVEETLEVRGRIREVFARKGNEFLTVDAVVLTRDGKPVQQVRHTAIWSIGKK